MTAVAPAVAFDGFSFRYSARQDSGVRDITFSVPRGQFVVLTGRSGCGKSTLIRAACGLIPHFHAGERTGDVRIGGVEVATTPSHELAGRVGAVFQDPRSQFFATTVEDEIAFGCENLGLPAAEIRTRVETAMETAGVAGIRGEGLFGLSSGQKQLVALASVIALSPEVLVLDEPSANLDTAAAERLATILARLKDEGRTIVVAEHRLSLLLPIADRIVRLDAGRIVHDGAPAELLALPDEQRRALGLRDPRPASPSERTADAWPGDPAVRRRRIDVDALSIIRGRRRILDGITLRIEAAEGEIIGITGPIGSGKTSLARAICGLTRHRGVISIDGERHGRVALRRDGFFVMQDTDYQLFSDTAAHELALSDATLDEETTRGILERLGLRGLDRAHPLSLSGGQKQRLAIAAAVASRSSVIVFDEPTSGLDGDGMLRVARTLESLSREGRLIVVTTHDEELLRECRAIRVELTAPDERDDVISDAYPRKWTTVRTIEAGAPPRSTTEESR